MAIRNRFSKKTANPTEIPGKTRTQQNFKEESDINVITARYLKTGVFPNARESAGIFGDFTSVDYMEMRNAIADIGQTFDTLPAKVRNKFQNDPYQLIRFVEKPENFEAALKLGLVTPPEGLEELHTDETSNQEDLVHQASHGAPDAPKTPVPPEPPKLPEKGK